MGKLVEDCDCSGLSSTGDTNERIEEVCKIGYKD
jgi:hypothetical protein